MNILVLHSSSDLYGASKILLIISEVLQQRGHTVQVVLSAEGPLSDALRRKQTLVHIIPLGILRRKYMSPAGIWNRVQTLSKAVRSITALIRKEQIDLVYSNTTAVLAGAFAARKTHTKHIWHIHEILDQSPWLFRLIGNLVNRYSDSVIAVSGAVKSSWTKFVKPEKITIVYNGISYTPFLEKKEKGLPEGIPSAPIIVGMIGRVHHWKGQDYFLRIAAILIRKYSQLHFVMAGDVFPGNEYLYRKLETIKKENGLTPFVTDLGYRTDIPALLNAFDIFVLPSTQPDPFPTVILEAMAAAKPVAATHIGGAPEMIENTISGILLPPDNAAAAAGLLETLIEDAVYRKTLGENARQRVVAVFSKQTFADKLIKLVE